MNSVDSFKLDRGGRDYQASVFVDEGPLNPRTEYDHSATEFYVVQNRDVFVNELTGAAGDALAHFLGKYRARDFDKIERAFHLWTVIAGSPVRLFTGQDNGYSQGDWHYWFALVDTAVMAAEGYGNTAAEVAAAEASDYAAYAYGDVYGVSVAHTDATGRVWESDTLWQIVDRDGKYIREVAAEQADELAAEIDAHKAELLRQANATGAGFVGVL